jgi:hypothetical protein
MERIAIILGRRCPAWLTDGAVRKVDEDEAVFIHPERYFVQTIILHVEADRILELRGFDKLSQTVILPAVILTRESKR